MFIYIVSILIAEDHQSMYRASVGMVLACCWHGAGMVLAWRGHLLTWVGLFVNYRTTKGLQI